MVGYVSLPYSSLARGVTVLMRLGREYSKLDRRSKGLETEPGGNLGKELVFDLD